MASITGGQREPDAWRAAWAKVSHEEHERLAHDDHVAGRNVSLILFSLIATGLVLIAITLAAVLAAP